LKIGKEFPLYERTKDTESETINAKEEYTHLTTSNSSKYILFGSSISDAVVNKQRRSG
jgi:hypothetical protein